MAFDPSTAQLAPDDARMSSRDDEERGKQTAFERNRGWTRPGPRQFTTSLQPDEEAKFQAWVKESKAPFDPGQQADFDMRGFWKTSQDPAEWKRLQQAGKIPADMEPAGTKIDPNDGKPHFPDYWKTPYHETFSNESQWATEKAPKWNEKDQLVTPDGKVLFDDKAQNKPAEPAKSKFDQSTATLWEEPSKPPSKDDGLPWDVPATGTQMRTAQEQIRKGEETISGLPAILRTAARGGQQLLGERPPPTPIEALEEAAFGLRPSKFVSGARAVAGAARVEPTVSGGPDPAPKPVPAAGEPIDAGSLRSSPASPWQRPPTPEPAASLEEAGLRLPEAATGTETVAVRQPDGTTVQVQVRTGEPPRPPVEPPAPTATEAPAPEPAPATPTAGRPRLPAPTTPWAPVAEAPADQPQAETPIAAPATEAPAPVAPTAAQPPSVGTFQDMRTAGYDKNPDHPLAGRIEHLKELAQSPDLNPREQRDVARRVREFEKFITVINDLPVEQRAMARSLRPDDIIQGKDKDGRTVVGAVDGFDGAGIIGITDANGLPHSVHAKDLEDVRHVAHGGQPIPVVPPSDQKRDEVPSPEAPSPESTPKGEATTVPPSPPTETAYGGPWTRVKTKDGEDASNRQGEPLYENPNGARATFDNGVPHTESVIEHPEKGLVPRNVVDRRGQFLTAEETGLGAAPPKPKSESLPKTGGEAGKSKPKTAEKPVMESGGTSEWKYLYDNEEGDPIYTNDQGVHSIVKDGVRIVEKVRLQPTKAGMAMSVPSPMEKEPAFRPALAPKPESESVEPPKSISTESLPAEAQTPITKVLASSADQITPKDMVLANLDQGGEISGVIAPDGRLYVFHEGRGGRYNYEVSHKNFREDFPDHDYAEVTVYNGNHVGIRATQAYTPAQIRTINGIRSHAGRHGGDTRVSYWDGGKEKSLEPEAHTDSKLEPLAPEHETWWNKNLTPYGRRLVMNKASVNLPDQVLWHHVSYDNKVKLLQHRDAAIENVAPPASTPAEKPSTEAAKPVEPKTATVADMPKPPTADLKGIPKTAYRGTGRADMASVYNGVAEPVAGTGRYSAFSKTDAEKFGPNVEEAPIDLKNPLVIRSDDQWRALTKEAGWEFPNPSFGMSADKMKAAAAKLKEVVQGKGHDGIIAWWNNDTPYDVDEQGRSIKTLRNALGVPQVIDYREPEAAKERYPYNISKYTDPTSIEADRIAVDARNGEMPKEVAVDILAAMTARGDIPEPFAKLMLNKMQVDYDGPLWNNALAGFQARQEAIRTNQPAPKAEEPQTVTHVTKKGKTLTGTIRKDLDLAGAKALDPYAFRKDGGYFIRSKPTAVAPEIRPEIDTWVKMVAEIFQEEGINKAADVFTGLANANNLTPAETFAFRDRAHEAWRAAGWKGEMDEGPPGQTLPEITQKAADETPPEPMTPLPPEPAPADAISLAQGKGPVPVTVEPDPTDKIKPKTRDITDADLAAATDMLEDRDEQPQIDRILDMLAKGWSRIDISEAPGVDLTPHEIDALQLANTMDEEERGLVRPEKESGDGLQSTLRLGDAGEGPEGVSEPGPVGEDRGAPAGEEPGGAPDAEGVAGTGTQGQTRRTNRGGGGGGGRTRTRNPDRLPDTGEGSDTRDAGRPPQERGPDTIEGTNYVIEPGALAESRTRLTKARDNLAAIELAKRIKADGRLATRAEQEVLAKYVGWGGIKNAFRDSAGEFGKGLEDIGTRLEQLLTPEEYRAANATVNNAHYTAEHVVRSMWDAVRQMGFTGGSVFEPGMGIGHFLGLMPQDVAQKSTYRGIERDIITTDIAQLLYPRAGIRQADYTRMALPEQAFDLVIGNPPFLDVAVSSDKKYPQRFMLHDYFFAKSLDAVRPGGLLAFVTSAGTMNKLDSNGREYLAERAEFLGGIRLPSSAFRQNAGTDVTTDILFFKRRPEGKVSLTGLEEPELAWTRVATRALPNAEGATTEGNVNQYFTAHPEMVLGQEGFFDKLYKDRYAVHQTPDTDLTVDLREAIDRLPRDVMTEEPTPEQKAALDFSSTEKKDGSFYVKDGTLMQYRGGAGREVLARGKGVEGGFTAADRDRVIKMIPVRDALRRVFAADLAEDEVTGVVAREKLNAAYDEFVKWFGPINRGTITFKRPSIIQQEGARAEAREEARFVGDRFVEGDFDATPMYDANAKVGEIARAREAARQTALAAGRTFNEGSFDPADMPDTVVEKRPNIRPFMSDPESYRLRSIESYDDSTNTATKKPIFTRSILTHEEEPKLNSAHDGVLWSLNKLGRFDVAAIAEKMGKPIPEIIGELGDDVFKVPGTEDTYQTKDQYLSGDVVTKLEEARKAAEQDRELLRNVIALEAAAPRPLAPSRISMVIGMPWIPPPVVSEFARDFLQLGNPRINYSEVTGTWIVEKPSSRNRDAPGLLSWGTSRRGAYDLLSDALNRTPPRVMTPGSRDNPPRFDPVATQAAQDMMAKIRDAFFDPETRSGWVLNDQTRANELADLYNGKMNREILRQHDGSYLTTPGVAASWSWRPHQTRVVSRIILEGNTYMAHAVGAGKTSAMIGAGMEMKRLGLVRKPMYVVPNHMLGQFTKEFYEQYPTARIAVADEERFHTDRRKQFIANVAQDDLDAVIITHSSFQKVPISDEFQADLIQEQIDMLVEAISQLDASSDRITVGRMNKQREKLEQRLSKATGTDKDQTLTFEEMGVDFVFVDEAHLFRKLSFATKQGQMKGISPEGSNMSWDLFTKVRYLDSQRPGRSVVFASGTPITNTMGELYSLSRFMQPDALKARGLSHFDAWAQTFGTTKSTLEETAAGTYQPVTRFGKFVNMPELYKMVGGVMDIVTPAQLEQYVTRPQLKGGERQFHMAPRSEILDRYQATLGARMEAIKARRGPPAPGDDIILSVINDGRHAAIDPRFVEQSQNDPTSKLNMMIENVARIYHETRDVQFYDPGTAYEKPSFRGPATQMIFANLGVNGRGPMAFSGYRWMKEALRRAGVPLDQIAFIGDYNSTIARQKLFNDMNEGKVSVLIGSTQKMGTGVNAQRRLIAVHNQDPLWFPADDEQRNGRILRQGNHNREIEIHDYTTKGTYDSAMWQMMAKKAGFIEQFFRGDPTLRDMEDIGEASMYEQASAMSTTDERIITLTQLKQDLEKARRRRAAHEDEQWALRTKYREHLSQAQYNKEKAERFANDIEKRIETTGKKFAMQVSGETFTVRKDALEALRKAVTERLPTMGDDTASVIGNIGGFRLRLINGKRGHYLELMTSGAWDKSLASADPIASAEDRIRYFEIDQKNAIAQETEDRRSAAEVEPYLGKEFEGGDEINRLDEAVRALTAILEAEAKAAESAKSGEPDDAEFKKGDRIRLTDVDPPIPGTIVGGPRTDAAGNEMWEIRKDDDSRVISIARAGFEAESD